MLQRSCSEAPFGRAHFSSLKNPNIVTTACALDRCYTEVLVLSAHVDSKLKQ